MFNKESNTKLIDTSAVGWLLAEVCKGHFEARRKLQHTFVE